MRSFQLLLPNGGAVTGIHSIPPRSASIQHHPLIVGLHGGTYDCHYFDANGEHTASKLSTALGVPFVSIDRPCYGGTSSFLPIPKDSDYANETGTWLHLYILPALWAKFGAPNNCNCIVLLSHSLGAIGATIVGAKHAQEQTPAYPLGGIIISGLGGQLIPSMIESPIAEPNAPPDHVVFPVQMKDALMFRPGTVHPDILARTEKLNAPCPFVELDALRSIWVPRWKSEWAAHIVAPVKFALVEQDCFWEGTEEHVRDCVKAFRKSIRVDGSLIRGAPHCLELSFWSQGWYGSCFGFAVECAASFAVQAV
ncbi:hypothetical protein BJY01DRAFT_230211 [Aspergillus pseudoustus]|uniref:AB hydrolase-1 domain-containing protein n=1 Tax=Aspergillus pseudoustus TaxID=1810923 RepID=A0ABR4ICA9_9EURO